MQPGDDGVVILDEKGSEEWEPTEEEIANYAERLGMDKEEDKDIMHLAREGLKAPLPPGWRPCQNSEGEIFYFDYETGQSSWDHPADEHYQNLVQEKKREKQVKGPNSEPAPGTVIGVSRGGDQKGQQQSPTQNTTGGVCARSPGRSRSPARSPQQRRREDATTEEA